MGWPRQIALHIQAAAAATGSTKPGAEATDDEGSAADDVPAWVAELSDKEVEAMLAEKLARKTQRDVMRVTGPKNYTNAKATMSRRRLPLEC